ncbi:DUF2510 domain-containing protein [Microbacterium galbinum]|uniref:DUF2510 domain-containing protein n=1 Tax=Microbacterium galbinum TaxID=2851646 RepID=A0ABY4IME1_9MICO|nr:DUF2510 domain-containing protein [Microbacterium galbinum]UPL13116.1 DUF2510 domain-containing protein [Microbacterium galbinum]
MTTPAGWYDDGSGRQRWWDGEQWTEHFAPEATAPEASAPETTTVSEQPTAQAAEEPLPVVPTEAEVDATIAVAEENEPSAHADAAAEAPASDVAPEAPAYVAPEAPAYVAPEAPAYVAPEAPAYAAPAYAAPGYPTTAPGGAPAYGVAPTGAYPGSAPYGGAPGGYTPYPGSPAAEPRPISVLGLVGLGLAVLGTILVCFLLTAVFGWILLFAGLVVSIVSLFLKGKKWPGITGIGVSVLGGIVGGIMAIVFFTFGIAQIAIDTAESYSPPPVPSIGTDGGEDSGEIVEGTMGSPVTVNQYSGESEVTITDASWGTSNGSSFEAENGGYLSVELTWEAISGDTSVNPLYFTVIDADGNEGTYDYFGDATLESAQLAPGETAQGTLSFDVAQSDSYTIIITDELLQDVAEVTVEASAR